MKLVIFGLSITSSWGNGHATTYRGLVRELAKRGHRVTFFERDAPWHAAHRDLAHPPHCQTVLYSSLEQCFGYYGGEIGNADWVMVGSYVPEGIKIAERVTRRGNVPAAFYDLDTPVTLAKLATGKCSYLRPNQVPRYRLYLSCTGGPVLRQIEKRFGSPAARPLYCSADPELHYPDPEPRRAWDLGFLGSYSPDRQQPLERLLCESAARWQAGRFVVAGPQYPAEIGWPANTERIGHLPPELHRAFYSSQRFTLNVTRMDMVKTGFSPSTRLFEAAACGVPVISDRWEGLGEFFEPGEEILTAGNAAEVLHYLREFPEAERLALGERARARVLGAHTAAHRAEQLEGYLIQAGG
jgi:spore maturation protein CgeB